jgi:hypothetical protein
MTDHLSEPRPHSRPPRSRGAVPRRFFALLGVLAGLGIPSPQSAAAQVILNTERFQVQEVEGFHLGADFSTSVQRGNTKVLNVSTSGIMGVLEGRHWIRTIFGGQFLRTEDRSILDQQFVQIRYSYLLSPTLRTFHFVQAQKNETLLLQSRWLVGGGIRRTFVQTPRTMLAAGTGVMGEWERLDPERLGPDDSDARDRIRMANMAVVSRNFAGGARLLNILYLQPDLERPSDLRILNDLGLAVPITDRLSASMSAEWRRDTRPPSTLERDDFILKMGLGIDIR